MGDILFVGVLAISILTQITAALYAVLNVVHTPKRSPWVFVAIGIVLMAVRRIITLSGVIATWETSQTVSWGAEITALIISILMCTGMVLINRMLKQLSGERTRQTDIFRESLHTSKNNLQSLESLLHTQASFATTDEQRLFATEIEQKVSAYALLQRQLFEHDQEVDTKEYLDELIVTIEDAYSRPGQFAPVIRQIERIDATPKETLYLGLLVSEALINAYKYGARGAQPTQITVTVRANAPGGKRSATVWDTGPGFPPDVLDGSRAGFGTTFLRSLNGADWTVILENDGGAVVRTTF